MTERNDKVLLIDNKYLVFYCPICKMDHQAIVDGSKGWVWNNDTKKPTINPSIRVRWDWGEKREKKCCHLFVRDGKLHFCGDCTHNHAGKIVDMVNYSDS